MNNDTKEESAMKYFPGMKRSIVCFSEEVRRMRENGELPVLREEDLYPQPIDDEPFEPDDEMEED